MDQIIDIALSLATLTILEIVLGVDNLVFLAIVSQKLPQHQQQKARRVGLTLSWILRLILLFSAVWLAQLTHPLINIFNFTLSVRDLFFLAGGVFLLVKATEEMHNQMEHLKTRKHKTRTIYKQFNLIVLQIALLDIVFSLDSVLTAIGLTNRFWLMATAITIAILVMIFVSEPASRFIEKNPTIRMLALSFLILIGMVLVADGVHFHVPRAYVYFAMGFSLFVEFMNLLYKKRKRS